jgi:CheY-like chemotaxis protein/anti-sigma regulatory factor (Ser/Thr protein kinase)
LTDLPVLSREAIADLAHELRSPLGGIEAMIELLALGDLDADQMRIVEALRASAAHLRSIADRTLGDRPAPNGMQDRLGELVDSIAVSVAARARARGLAFGVDFPDDLRNVRVEAAVPLRQVIENLVDNAVRASTTGEIRLKFEAHDERITVLLSDEGPGMSAAELAERIGQADQPARRKGRGLAISARLVARHGGTLSVEPRAGRCGSVFRFDWPSATTRAGGTVLIVDDHPAARLVLRTILAAFGLRAAEAASLAEARIALSAERPSLILSDLRLGEECGLTLAAELAAEQGADRPAFVIVSADDPREEGRGDGIVDGVILKPITVQAIVDCLREFRLEGSGAPRSESQGERSTSARMR